MATKKKESTEKTAGARNVGRVVQVIGPVLDVEFEPEHLPELYNAVVIDHAGNGAPAIRLTAEVQQHIGRNQVRAVAMSSDRKSTRLNSSHGYISYAVFCLKKKKKKQRRSHSAMTCTHIIT